MNVLLTRKEAADRLKVSLPTLDRLLASGEIPVVKIGRAVRIPERALEEWITESFGKVI